MKSKSISILLNDVFNIFAWTIAQCVWMWAFISIKAGLVNFLPTFIFLAVWYLFVKVEFRQKEFFWLYWLPGFILTLRLPFTISKTLEPLSWLLYLAVICLILQRIVNYFKLKKQVAVLAATVTIVLFNAVSHVSLDSPYTYTFRIANNLKSEFTGVENNRTWECPYENQAVAVNCDMRHFIAPEKIFTDPDPKKASFSVLLSRFFYGYLSSLIGFEGHRWIASLTLNILFWILACAAIFRICDLTNLGQSVGAIAMLCCASSWGFFHFVGQPSPHVAGYAYAATAIWATIELIHQEDATLFASHQQSAGQGFESAPEVESQEPTLQMESESPSEKLPASLNSSDVRRIALLCAVLISGSLAYEVYPVSLTSAFLLFVYRRRTLAILILLAQMLLNFLWITVSLRMFLGTVGGMNDQSSGAKNIVYDIQTWISVLTHLDIGLGLKLVSTGLLSYIYGSLIFGALASLILIIDLASSSKQDKAQQLLLVSCASLCLLTLLSTIFIAPQTAIWSPNSGMQPRLAFFTYPVNTIAIAFIANLMFKNKFQYIPAVATFLISNITLTGLVSLAMLFDFGLFGIYWK